jgi:DNA repair protein RecN (Recombination protein N)
MLEKLKISNYALIDELEVQFTAGFNCITGETGAGKSILLGAIGLILGNRADTKVLFDKERKCIVEAQFKLKENFLMEFFSREALDYDQELIIRREISATGKSRAFVNDSPVNLNQLQELSSLLVDLHQQFDTRNLNDKETQLHYLDALAGSDQLLLQYQNTLKAYRKLRKELQRIEQEEEEIREEHALLSFQLEELSKWNLDIDEQISLEEEIDLLTNAEEIKRVMIGGGVALVDQDPSLTDKIQDILREIENLNVENKEIKELKTRLSENLEEIKDIGQEMLDLGERTDHDPKRLEELNERLNGIYRLQQKYHVQTIAELMDIEKKAADRIREINKKTGDTIQLKKQIGQIKADLIEKAGKLTIKRKAISAGFEKQIQSLLSALNMEHARLQVEIVSSDEFNNFGCDDVQFLFATNKGSGFLPIKNIASGGELSRLSLCIKSLVASSVELPTLIFDEIDTGVSGAVAMKMGEMLQQLAIHHQVLNITHSPQIASKANTHFYVEKETSQDRTYTRLSHLNPEERLIEIAKMLSGDPPSDTAIENARSLMALAL